MKVDLKELYDTQTMCPTCGDEFKSEFGVRMHHTKKHDERLDNHICECCGCSFYDSNKRKWCDGCSSMEGEKNPNWDGGKEKSVCEDCGNEIKYYKSEKEGKYCKKCWRKHANDNFENPKEHLNDIRPTVDTKIHVCNGCGCLIYSTEDRRFCSKECMGKYRSKYIRGRSHHNYLHGNKYGSDWWEKRREQRERDNNSCVVCNKGEEQIGRKPDVHHIKPVSQFDNPNHAHTEDNLVTLCPKHHLMAEEGELELPDQ